MEASLFIVGLNNLRNNHQENMDINEIFIEGEGDQEQQRRRLRATVHEVADILTFLYCTDNIGLTREEHLEQINRYIGGDPQ